MTYINHILTYFLFPSPEVTTFYKNLPLFCYSAKKHYLIMFSGQRNSKTPQTDLMYTSLYLGMPKVCLYK